MREIGHVNRVAVLSRDKTDVSRGGGVNDRRKRMGDWCLERMTLNTVILQLIPLQQTCVSVRIQAYPRGYAHFCA